MEKFTFNSTSTQIHLKNGTLEKCIYGQTSEEVFREFKGAWAVGTSEEKLKKALSVMEPGIQLGSGKPGKSFTIKPKKIEDDLTVKLNFLKNINKVMSDQEVKSDLILMDAFSKQISMKQL